MKEGLKIVTIGGGSSYTPELIEGFINRYDKLPVRELWLVDIEEGRQKLEITAGLARRMIEHANVPIKLFTSLDRREALKDADFVTTQMRVGQIEARIKDERIPISHGLLGQETNGAGGLFKGLRTIPVILDICRDMEELCPDAWLINFTNPVGMVTEAVFRYGAHKKTIGLCNVPIGMERGAMDILKAKKEDIFMTFAGLNHMVFANHVFLKGKEVTERVIEGWGTQSMKNIKALEWSSDFLKTLGVVPCPYHRYYYMSVENLKEELRKYEEHGTRAEEVKKLEAELFEIYKDKDLATKPKQLEQRGGAYYSDAACNLICSIYNDTRDIQVVDTYNHGAIDFLEKDAAVEISCVITKNGPVPLAVGDLPDTVKGLVSQIKSFEIAGAKAAVTGDYNDALTAMIINPLVASQSSAIEVLNELLLAHEKYLPQFSKAVSILRSNS
ncbi:MAG: 6-phospho-beta-glucosidase [Lachnospiraceae bacterium]|nr:6-phospho-beta-glucosidase [Lachnospiraceae bacterium]